MIVRARTTIDERLLKGLADGIVTLDKYKCTSNYFFDSGSSSLRFFLRLFGKRKKVGIQVYTCSTVLDAIRSEEDEAIFLDVDISYYTSRIDEIRSKIHLMDILVLTHLFGIPNPDYLAIKELCRENGVILIDDLCQTFHAKIGETYLEDLSDNYFYSFFYDKPISMLAGGMLKVSAGGTIMNNAEVNYAKLPKKKDNEGRKQLKILFLMHELLSPDLYIREFRYGSGWKTILRYWPVWGGKKYLNRIIKGRWLKVVSLIQNRLIKSKPRKREIKIMSDVEVEYVLNMFDSFTNNNHILLDFYKRHGFVIPSYLKDNRITCSVAKRAIVDFEVHLDDVQVGLYNWPDLICDKNDYENYPGAVNIIKKCTNIPVWTDYINLVEASVQLR